jgi:hypothetical protein
MGTSDGKPTGDTNGEPRAKLAWGISSVAVSIASYTAFALYGGWHWDLVRLNGSGVVPPFWLTWRLIDGLKIVSVILAFAAFGLAIETLRRKRWLIGVVALALSVLQTSPL